MRERRLILVHVQSRVPSQISAKEMVASAVSRPRKAHAAAFLIVPILPNQKDRRVSAARGIVLRVIVPSVNVRRAIGLSALALPATAPSVNVAKVIVPLATALSANAARGIGLVVHAHRGMAHPAIKANSVTGLRTGAV